MTTENLEKMAQNVRKKMISVADYCRNSLIHWGSSLSCVEILLSVIGDVSNISNVDREDKSRDLLIISKGHAALAYYAVLEECGLLEKTFAEEYQKNGSRYTEELTINPDLMIECSTGSLGLGLPYAVGLAIKDKREGNDGRRIFCLVGDGECDEGSNWEAVMLASQQHLDNLTLIVDRNGLQLDGDTELILSQANLSNRLGAFDWKVKEAEGHDFKSLREGLLMKQEKPLAVIAHTVKGKGISFMENDFSWHEKNLQGKLLQRAKEEVGLL